MLTYSLDERGDLPIYEYIYRSIREDIAGGKLSPGEHLPSKRAFARQLSVSMITIENAYAQLETEGYIYALPRKGFFVADLGDMNALPVKGQTDAGDDEDDIEEVPAHAEAYFADFAGNQTQPDSFPFSNWARLSRRLLSENQQELLNNPPWQGVYALRRAIADHLRSFRGLQVSPKQIIIGAGSEHLYAQLIQFLGFDKIYASEDPGYARPSQVFAAHGVNYRAVALDENGISVEALERSGAQVVHVTPSHHFPTGITMPAVRRYELLRWAGRRADRVIIEDDYDSEIRMSGRPLPALFGMADNRQVIYMNTFTKSLASTIRISYMVLPEQMTEAYEKTMGFYSSPVPTFEQYTLAAFIGEGYFEKHINRMRVRGRRKREALLAQIRQSGLEKWCHVEEEHAGLHFLLHMDERVDTDAFEASLKEQGIRLRPMRDFYEDKTRKTGQYVMNYSAVDPELFAEAVRRIAAAAEHAVK